MCSFQRHPAPPEPLDIAWAGGYFEGEGCIGTGYAQQPNIVRLWLNNTDLDSLQKFTQIAGCGSVYKLTKNPDKKQKWVWNVTRRDDVERLIIWLYPHLGERQKCKADEALLIIENANFGGANERLA